MTHEGCGGEVIQQETIFGEVVPFCVRCQRGPVDVTEENE